MRTHEFAKKLLDQPDMQLFIGERETPFSYSCFKVEAWPTEETHKGLMVLTPVPDTPPPPDLFPQFEEEMS
jgi:hypothetical protein